MEKTEGISVTYKGVERRTGFWGIVIKDTMDIYALSTALYVFVITLPIILHEIKRPVTRFIDVELFGYAFGEIPMALQIVLISVLLTTLVNYFRLILNVALLWLRRKLKIQANGG